MRKPKYLICFHCKEQIFIESRKYLSIVNWEWMNYSRDGALFDREEIWKLDFHNDCFEEIAGKKFIEATKPNITNEEKREKMRLKIKNMQKQINYVKMIKLLEKKDLKIP